MFGLLHFMLDLYFATTLSVAGLAKLDNPRLFVSALSYQYRLPAWSASIVGKGLPWLEILIAVALLFADGYYKIIITAIVLFLFIIFFVLNKVRQTENPQNVCFCYGNTLQRSGIQANSITSFIQLLLAGLLFLLSFQQSPWMHTYYILSMLLLVLFCGWIGWRLWQRSRHILYIKKEKSSTTSVNALT